MTFGDLKEGDKFWHPVVSGHGKGRFDVDPRRYTKSESNVALDKFGRITGFLNKDKVRLA